MRCEFENMQIKFEFWEQIDMNTDIAKSIYNLLIACDKEFVPPLSTRNTTTQVNFNLGCTLSDLYPYQYLTDILKQQNILAIVDDLIVGIMSFRYNYKFGEAFDINISKDALNNYVSTICINKDYRRYGIAGRLYNYIENNLPNKYKGDYVSTRTWSTNKSHINLLYKYNYSLAYTVANDREYNGTKLDTLYFIKYLKK